MQGGITPIERKMILSPRDLDFERFGVLNPAVFYENGLVHLFYRAVAENNYSSIGYCILKDDKVIYQSDEPILKPESAFEIHGLEDPRLVKLKNKYYLFYTVYDGSDAQVAYAVADQLPDFKKQSIISPPFTYGEIAEMKQKSSLQNYLFNSGNLNHPEDEIIWDKDAFIFPEYIHGKIIVVHRFFSEIQFSFLNSFEQLDRSYWSNYLSDIEEHSLMEKKYWFENAYIGGGVPPIKTEKGWLLIYHAVENSEKGLIYRAGAALLDLEDPLHVIGRLSEPLFEPLADWEMSGYVNNVVFPTGAVLNGDNLDIYYGAADKRIGRIRFSLAGVLANLSV